MGKFIDITGITFNSLTVIGRLKVNKWGKPAWVCVCECGNFKVSVGHHLTTGHTQSCGCKRLANTQLAESGLVVKTCSKCKKRKPLSSFYKDNAKPLGVQSACKTCKDSDFVKYKINNKERLLKQSNDCYHRNKHKISNVEWWKQYRIDKKIALKLYEKNRWIKDKVNMAKCNKQYHKDNKVQIAKRHIKNRIGKPPISNVRRLEQNFHARIVYSTSDKSVYLERSAKRRAGRLHATPPWYEKKEVSDIYKLADKIRNWGVDVHVDHVIPLQGKLVSGLHCIDNLNIISAYQNLSKSNKFNVI